MTSSLRPGHRPEADGNLRLAQRLAELRESFDRSFALPPAAAPESRKSFLIVGVGSDRYVLDLDAISGVENRRKIVPLPLVVPELLGLAGLRGQLTLVFSLAAILGLPTRTESAPWLVVCKSEATVALACDRFEGAVQVLNEDIYSAEQEDSSAGLARQTIRLGSSMLRAIDVPAVVAAAKQRLERR